MIYGNDTVAAICTPNGAGSISVIRISGPSAIDVADRVFLSHSGKKLRDIKGYTALYGSVYEYNENSKSGVKLDECVALVFRAPHSYTGENVVELSVHGSAVSAKLTLRACFNAGALPAAPGEFTKRAFLSGKMDLSQAESVMNVISATGKTALSAAVNTLDGAVARKIEKITDVLVENQARLEMWCDSPDDEDFQLDTEQFNKKISQCCDQLDKLIKDYDNAKAVTLGVNAAIVGRPNAGKSTLMNLLLGEERSIVTSVAGTTRDTIEETAVLGDVTLRLSDTAGIHSSDDEVEKIGIERALKKIDTAQFVICVFDASEPLNDDDISILEKCKDKKAIGLVNKDDLEMKTDMETIKKYLDCVLCVCGKDENDKEKIIKSINDILLSNELDTSAGVLCNERQHRCCVKAYEYLRAALDDVNNSVTLDAVSMMVSESLNELFELSGKIVREEIVNDIFSKFCVGK